MKEVIPTDQKKSLDYFGVASNESNVRIAARQVLVVEWWRLSRIQPTTNFGDTSNGFQDERG